MYDEICVKIVCFQNELLHFEDWNFGQFLRVDKTCFLRPGHICDCPCKNQPSLHQD